MSPDSSTLSHQAAARTSAPQRLDYRAAERRLREEFSWNPWFLNSYWPENEPRIRLMSQVALERVPPPARVLEIGCASGFVAFIFRMFGHQVDACDAYHDEKREVMFRENDIRYHDTNLNSVNPLSEVPDASYDLVLLGEVFEHILNQPAGLLRSIHRILRPGGTLILSTPNPSTLANAVRLVRDNYLLWGTDEFLRETKVEGDRIIDHGGIHYREYPARIVRDLLTEVGFRVDGLHYVQMGIAPQHRLHKRAIKWFIQVSGLGARRIFSPDYLMWATKPA